MSNSLSNTKSNVTALALGRQAAEYLPPLAVLCCRLIGEIVRKHQGENEDMIQVVLKARG